MQVHVSMYITAPSRLYPHVNSAGILKFRQSQFLYIAITILQKRIVHFWLPLRYSLTLIFKSFNVLFTHDSLVFCPFKDKWGMFVQGLTNIISTTWQIIVIRSFQNEYLLIFKPSKTKIPPLRMSLTQTKWGMLLENPLRNDCWSPLGIGFIFYNGFFITCTLRPLSNSWCIFRTS